MSEANCNESDFNKLLCGVKSYSDRFMGVDISYRRFGCDWPKPWRLKRCSSKRANQGILDCEYFDTLEELLFYAANAT